MKLRKITSVLINKETGERFYPVFLTDAQVEAFMNPNIDSGTTYELDNDE